MDVVVSRYEEQHSCKIEMVDNFFYTKSSAPAVLMSHITNHVEWPQKDFKTEEYWFHNETLEGLIVEALSEVWNCNIDDIGCDSKLRTRVWPAGLI